MNLVLSQQKVRDIENLKVGDSVKLWLENKERLWVEVVEINNSSPKRIRGKIDSYPNILETVKFGDAVTFESEHVLDIIKN